MRIFYKIRYKPQNNIPVKVGVEVQVDRTCNLGGNSSPLYVVNSLGDIVSVSGTVGVWIAADIAAVTAARAQQILNNAMKTTFQTALGQEINIYVDIP
jgi:hypothetical protein